MLALGRMLILTDFADQAVVLPLIAAVALTFGVLGWRRGALAWLVAVGCSFASVLVLKVVLTTCGPAFDMALLRSPSGHTAAAAVIAGGIAVALGRGRWSVAVIAGLGALLIGATRVALGLHTIPEVAVGGALGVLGALGFGWLGGRPPVLQLRWLFAVIVAVALLLHGQHLNAETRIRSVAYALLICPGSVPPATLAGAAVAGHP
jgi:hypothetical protein